MRRFLSSRKSAKLDKDLSTLKGKEKVLDTSISFSPNIQLENELNARIEGLLHENTKLQSTLKGFTDSSIYMGRMLDGIGNHSQRQGLGFKSNTKKQKGKPNQVFEKRITNVPSHSFCIMTRIFLMNPTLERGVISAIVLVT